MRLIDADWVLAHVKPYEPSDEEWVVTGGTTIRLIHNAVDNAPTVDAVVVTRCKDCKNWHTTECALDYAMFEPTDDSFCSYGERKDGDTNGS